MELEKSNKLCIALVCDFFYPHNGGVETHIWSIAQGLIELGNKVIVITRAYDERKGVRYMTNGLKVYYLPVFNFFSVSIPIFFFQMPLLRYILISESVQIIHIHQYTSLLCLSLTIMGYILNLKVIYSDHSLIEFEDTFPMLLDKIHRHFSPLISSHIGVSYVHRDNMILRWCLKPEDIYIIPNAVDTSIFIPDESKINPKDKINIIVMSRMAYRKGVDLLVRVIPLICNKYDNIYFIIGGSGPKLIDILEMRDRENLKDRIEILGDIEQSHVRDVLIRGHIFLNCSLTESFCIALLEAVSCGLISVSTNVGGIPEILPSNVIITKPASSESLLEGIDEAIVRLKQINRNELHEIVKSSYSWLNTSKRIYKVYLDALKKEKMTVLDVTRCNLGSGHLLGLLISMLIIWSYVVEIIIDYVFPVDQIEKKDNLIQQLKK